MKYLTLTIALLFSALLYAGPRFSSGDTQIDRWLINIDYVAQDNFDESIQSVANRFGIKQSRLLDIQADMEYSIAELYMMCAIAESLGMDLGAIEKSYRNYSPKKLHQFLKDSGMPQQSSQFKTFKQLVQQGAPEDDVEKDKNNIFKKKRPNP